MIPGNDDAIKSIRLFTSALAEAAIDGAASGRTDAQVVAPEVADVDVVKVSRSIDADEKSPEASAAPEPAEEAAAEGEES